MLSRSLFATSLFSLCLAGSAVVGCAAPTTEDAEVGESADELSSAAQALVGKYYAQFTTPRQFGRLTLRADGTYTASVDIFDVAFCVASPCLGPEEGTWNAWTSGAKLRLRLRATGEPSRYFDAQKGTGELKLTRAGQTQTLSSLEKNGCLDNADCAEREECGPKFCLMVCLVDDPFCCGPSTCQPKTPPPPKKICGGFAGLLCGPGEECVDDPDDACDPNAGGADCSGICVAKPPPTPPPTCWGSWLDENGTCRTPADGVYPDACCAGQTTPCGPSKCGVGETCCNSLSGICTKPGELCAF